MGICVPYIVMMLCMLLTTYSGCWRNGHLIYVPFLTLVCVGILALLATPHRAVTGLYLSLVMLTGLYIGRVNYTTNMFHYCSTEDRRAYSNVAADASSDTYWDAGTLTFGDQAHLSQNNSVGYLYNGVTYCVAPILLHAEDCTQVSRSNASQNTTKASQNTTQSVEIATPPSFLQRTSRMHMSLNTDGKFDVSLSTSRTPVAAPVLCNTTTPTRVEFWAIGTGCCGARKDFHCDGGADPEAHSGVLVRATGDGEHGGDQEKFFHAISQAVAAYDLPAPERPVLIRWGEDPGALQDDWSRAAISMVLLTAVLGFLVMLGIGFGSFWFVKTSQKNLEVEREAQRQRQKRPSLTGSSSSMLDGLGWLSKKPQEPNSTSGNRDQLRV